MCAGAGGRRGFTHVPEGCARFRKGPVQGKVQVASAGYREFRKVADGVRISEVSGRCLKFPVHGQVVAGHVPKDSQRFRCGARCKAQVAGAGSGRFRCRATCRLQAQVPEGCARFRCKARRRLQAEVPEGSRRLQKVGW